MAQQIDLIFTRDFSLAVCDFWQDLVTTDLTRDFGMGIQHQLIRFNGYAMETYRPREEMEKIRDWVLQKSASDPLFSATSRDNYYQAIDQTRALLQQMETHDLAERIRAVPESIRLFHAFYPFVMLSNFLPGPWRELCQKRYGNDAKVLLDRWFAARARTEGTFERVDMFWRNILKSLLEQAGTDVHLHKHIRFTEFLEMLDGKPAPSLEVLTTRSKGYTLYHNELLLGKDFREFLREQKFIYEGLDIRTDVAELHGQVACEGGVIKGKVQRILNVDGVANFQEGNILVTAMTDPHYLPAMKKAAAIITDEGGITCHAAIVSRELAIPCVIGTKIATRVLKDGDNVTIDTTTGVVQKH